MPLDVTQPWPPPPVLHLDRPGEPELATRETGGMPPPTGATPPPPPPPPANVMPAAIPVGVDLYPTARKAMSWSYDWDAAGNAYASFPGYVMGGGGGSGTGSPGGINVGSAAAGIPAMITYQQGNGRPWYAGLDQNGNWSIIDSSKSTTPFWISTNGNTTISNHLVGNAAYQITGFGQLIVGSNTVQGLTVINGPPATARQISWRTNNITKWQMNLGTTAEPGTGNAGADFRMDRFADDGSYLGIGLTIVRATGVVSFQAANHRLSGCNDGSSAAAGMIGEFASANVASGTPVALTTSTFTAVTSISLTAGDWDVWGSVGYTVTGSTATRVQAYITTVANAGNPGLPNGGAIACMTIGLTSLDVIPAGKMRLNLAATTTVYLGTFVTFTGGTGIGAWGFIGARRRR